MPKSKDPYPYYAVQNGHEGPRVYTSRLECEKNLAGLTGVKFGGFYSLVLAQRYIAPALARHSRLKVSKLAFDGKETALNVTDAASQTHTNEGENDVIVPEMDRKVNIEEEMLWQSVEEVYPVAGGGAELSEVKIAEVTAPLADKTMTIEPVHARVDVLDALVDNQPASKSHWSCCDQTPSTSEPAKEDSDAHAPPPLSDEQQHILELVRTGRNIFFTGSAGTGKSVLIRAIIGLWPSGCRRLAITASTGAASVAFPGGRTVHSWAAIGLGTKDADLLIQEILCDKTQSRRWRQTDCLLIDEISMLDGELFDKLEYMAKQIRKDSRPFGGIQLVVSGDFFQLPPVPGPSKAKATFTFEANSWNRCFDTTYKLTHVFRQSDQEFVNMLNEMRLGKVSAKTEAEFKYLEREVKYYDDIGPTELFPLKAHVERANQMHLDCIDNLPVTFYSHDVGGVDERNRHISYERQKEILKGVAAQEELVLKKGAQAKCGYQNKVQGVLVNGSVGVVEDFCTIREVEKQGIAPFDKVGDELQCVKDGLPTIVRDSTSGWWEYRYPLVRFTNGRTLLCVPMLFKQENRMGNLMAGRTQVPLILAWALSVHKSQGATLERVKVDLARTFERGQAYVALSRATSLDTLQVLNFDASKVEAHPHVLQWMGHEADERDLEYENYQRAQAEADYRRRLQDPEEDYFAHVDDIDEIDIYLMDCEGIAL